MRDAQASTVASPELEESEEPPSVEPESVDPESPASPALEPPSYDASPPSVEPESSPDALLSESAAADPSPCAVELAWAAAAAACWAARAA